ncbi:MAG: potassium channel family protein [Clostridium sp.]|nr:potassium channel family protein [Clostridium sp.]MCM1461046.1 potassium channel family protein [Bacteroides sp.]
MKEKIYNIAICFLSLASVALAITDFTSGLTHTLKIIDLTIYAFFVIDYLLRFAVAKNKKMFIRSNILDLVAIIPFNSAFRIFRFLKASKLLRLTKLLRVGSVSARGVGKIKVFLNTNGFKYVLCLSAGAIVVSTFLIMYFENMSFTDALWWSFVTATTVGYGDLSPITTAGRIIAALLMLVGIGLIGSLTSSITSFFLNKENTTCNSEKIEMVMTLYNKLNNEEQEAFKQLIIIDEKLTTETNKNTGER